VPRRGCLDALRACVRVCVCACVVHVCVRACVRFCSFLPPLNRLGLIVGEHRGDADRRELFGLV
jgi:hypothetical protein